MLRTLAERAIEVKTNLYLCFTDSCKAFDKVKQTERLKMLKDINVERKDLKNVLGTKSSCESGRKAGMCSVT